MVFIRYLSFKTGINPSARSRIDMSALTGSQKLELTSSRIFGFNIGGNQRNGSKELRKPLVGDKRAERYNLNINDNEDIELL